MVEVMKKELNWVTHVSDETANSEDPEVEGPNEKKKKKVRARTRRRGTKEVS
jgi:hypothetical protein